METQRGSALLITMIVITVIGTIAFAIGASTISSFRRQTQLEDSLNAYQAAVAGLEDGLLRWRYNKDTETPIFRLPPLNPIKESGELNCPALRPHTTTAFYDRVNLSTGHVTYCIDPGAVPPPDPSEIVYDIKIHYKKGPGKAEVVEPIGTNPALKKDDVVEYDVKDAAQTGGLKAQLEPESGSPNPGDIFEVVVLDEETGRPQTKTFRGIPLSRMKDTPSSLNIDATADSIRIKYLGQDVKKYELHPVSNDPTTGASIDSRISSIETIGYFGLAKRKLKLQLDRKSGNILPLFDFALFAEQSGIAPISP